MPAVAAKLDVKLAVKLASEVACAPMFDRSPKVAARSTASRAPDVPGSATRRHPLLALHQAVGNHAVAAMLRSNWPAADVISKRGHPLEREADRVADNLGTARVVPADGTDPRDIRPAQRSGDASGAPLPDALRTSMERSLGMDLGEVRLHTDDAAAKSARNLSARAFTIGADIVFGSGQYRPGTPDGRRLLAHELVHVLQSRHPDTPLILRDELPSGYTEETYTRVQTRRLNPKGAFTSQVLEEISEFWTQQSVMAQGRAETAQKVVDALESSADFVMMAKALDVYYGRRGGPTIIVGPGHAGTSTVPRGTIFQWKDEDPAVVDEHADRILIDYKKSNIIPARSEAEQITAFVRAVAHETAHAYNRIKGRKRPGLRGKLEDEARTRRLEAKVLDQVRRGSSDTALRQSLTEQIEKTKKGLDLESVAFDLSSGGLTYAESYFIDAALSDSRGARTRALAAVPPKDRTALDALVREPLSDETVDTNLLRTAVFSQDHALPHQHLLMDLLYGEPTLNDLLHMKEPPLRPDERVVFHHVLMTKAYQIRGKIARSWREAKDVTGAAARTLAEQHARQYLGLPNLYSNLRK